MEKLSSMKGEIDLWFSTSGGFTNNMFYLIDYLNCRKDEISLTITNELMSAGTLLLTDFKGKIRHRDLEFILFHVFDREKYSHRENKPADKFKRQDKKTNRKFAKKLLEKEILNEKQISKFLKGKDILLYKKEINKLFKKD